MANEYENEGLRRRIAELEEEVTELKSNIALFKAAKRCSCGDVGYFLVPDPHTGEAFRERCAFCWCDKDSLFNVLIQADKD